MTHMPDFVVMGDINLDWVTQGNLSIRFTDLAENEFPRTFYNGNNEFLFVRNVRVSNTSYHLFTKRVAVDGTDRDLNPSFIDSAPRGVLNGAMATASGHKRRHFGNASMINQVGLFQIYAGRRSLAIVVLFSFCLTFAATESQQPENDSTISPTSTRSEER